MSIDEFHDQRWGANMKALYQGTEYAVGSVNFQESLIGLDDTEDDFIWVRCENVELVTPNV